MTEFLVPFHALINARPYGSKGSWSWSCRISCGADECFPDHIVKSHKTALNQAATHLARQHGIHSSLAYAQAFSDVVETEAAQAIEEQVGPIQKERVEMRELLTEIEKFWGETYQTQRLLWNRAGKVLANHKGAVG